MLITQKQYEKWRDLILGDLDIEKILPKTNLLPIEKKKMKVGERLQQHKRAKSLKSYDLINQEWTVQRRFLPKEYKRGLCFNDAYVGLCPNPFSIDLYRGGLSCYLCHYCFSIRCEQALLSAFYDNFHSSLEAPMKEESLRREWRKEKYSDSMIGKAIKRRLVLHLGNNIESFIPAMEKRHGIGYAFLKLMNEEGYPCIINTKSDIFDSDKFLKILGEMGKNVMIQMTIISPYDKIGKKIEPLAPLVSRRLEVLKTLNQSGIRAVVRCEPFIYTISPSTDKGLEDFGNALLDAEVPYINVGAYNTSVKSDEIVELFVKDGYCFDDVKSSVSGLYQTLVLEKALFKLKDMGLSVGSFNPGSYALQDTIDCCGFTPQDNSPNVGLDRFNIVELTRKIIKDKKELSWSDFLRWAKPIYSGHYIERTHLAWNNDKGVPCTWWGEFKLKEKIHGLVEVDRDEDNDVIYKFSFDELMNRRMKMVEVANKLF